VKIEVTKDEKDKSSKKFQWKIKYKVVFAQRVSLPNKPLASKNLKIEGLTEVKNTHLERKKLDISTFEGKRTF